jgi:hypothetical protein
MKATQRIALIAKYREWFRDLATVNPIISSALNVAQTESMNESCAWLIAALLLAAIVADRTQTDAINAKVALLPNFRCMSDQEWFFREGEEPGIPIADLIARGYFVGIDEGFEDRSSGVQA